MIDASHCKVHPHAAGAVGGNQDMSRTKGDSIPKCTLPWMRMVYRSKYLSQRIPKLIAKKLYTFADFLLADKGCDTLSIVDYAHACGMTAVIPPKCNRKEQRVYDKHLYKLRRLVENAFLHLKHWRGIATRYAKNFASFLAAVQIRCIALWCAVLT